MAIKASILASDLLTYEQYMTEGEINRRYDIVDGVRIFMPAPTWRHQRIQVNTTDILRNYEKSQGTGYVIPPPFDVLISRSPLRTRQPDVLFITKARLEQGGGIPEKGLLEIAPELVVEILSDSERESAIQDKIADYLSIGIVEAWLVRPAARTVEVLRLSPTGAETAATYDETQTLQSLTFHDLAIPIADIFKP